MKQEVRKAVHGKSATLAIGRRGGGVQQAGHGQGHARLDAHQVGDAHWLRWGHAHQGGQDCRPAHHPVWDGLWAKNWKSGCDQKFDFSWPPIFLRTKHTAWKNARGKGVHTGCVGLDSYTHRNLNFSRMLSRPSVLWSVVMESIILFLADHILGLDTSPHLTSNFPPPSLQWAEGCVGGVRVESKVTKVNLPPTRITSSFVTHIPGRREYDVQAALNSFFFKLLATIALYEINTFSEISQTSQILHINQISEKILDSSYSPNSSISSVLGQEMTHPPPHFFKNQISPPGLLLGIARISSPLPPNRASWSSFLDVKKAILRGLWNKVPVMTMMVEMMIMMVMMKKWPKQYLVNTYKNIMTFE